jgi:hypothetical protein
MTDRETEIAVLQEKVENLQLCTERIKDDIKDLQERKFGATEACRKTFISKELFEPIQKLVYGITALILLGVMGALLSLVIKR